MAIKIIKAGVLDLVQDTGRFGFSELGINPGGPMDSFAAAMANSLVGNNEQKAVLEIHFPGPQVLFTEDVLISITGADFNPTINNEPVPLWHPVLVKKNTLLQFSALKWGSRAYLSIHGGFAADNWLNSYSTNIKAGKGGWKGRKLEKGDELQEGFNELPYASLFTSKKDFQPLRWSPDVKDIYFQPHDFFYIEGKENIFLTAAAREKLEKNEFIILPQSDRMGYHLKGDYLDVDVMPELVSTAVSFGTMQLMPDGQLVVLMAEHHTTGGYPRVGHIISAHLPKLAQLNATEKIRFKKVDLKQAESLLIAHLQELENLKALCLDHLNQLTCIK